MIQTVTQTHLPCNTEFRISAPMVISAVDIRRSFYSFWTCAMNFLFMDCKGLVVNLRILGQVHRTFMRGCLSDIIDYNTTTVDLLTSRDRCLHLPMKYLFAGNYRVIQKNQQLTLCTCHESLCNNAASFLVHSMWVIVFMFLTVVPAFGLLWIP
ncbi:unnamed protein product [Soboliphyme baturini]|uniref:UPAR/Ly6 domain-containing protein n=1 Tax=Soboliphyme baturini TaxID=241478 RepID=A0A183IF06_9BILA|nr:unnamed protein product [Soboliphyme baturini]